jgi:hypothetical protein
VRERGRLLDKIRPSWPLSLTQVRERGRGEGGWDQKKKERGRRSFLEG